MKKKASLLSISFFFLYLFTILASLYRYIHQIFANSLFVDFFFVLCAFIFPILSVFYCSSKKILNFYLLFSSSMLYYYTFLQSGNLIESNILSDKLYVLFQIIDYPHYSLSSIVYAAIFKSNSVALITNTITYRLLLCAPLFLQLLLLAMIIFKRFDRVTLKKYKFLLVYLLYVIIELNLASVFGNQLVSAFFSIGFFLCSLFILYIYRNDDKISRSLLYALSILFIFYFVIIIFSNILNISTIGNRYLGIFLHLIIIGPLQFQYKNLMPVFSSTQLNYPELICISLLLLYSLYLRFSKKGCK